MSASPVYPAKLLAAMASGDQRALEVLYRAWSCKVRLFARLQLARLQLADYGLDAHAMADKVTADIAHIQQAPEGTIKTRLFQGRLNLRRRIERWFVQEGGRHD